MDIKLAKQKLRHEMKELRNGLDIFSVEKLSDEVFNNFKKLSVLSNDVFFVYNSFGSEVMTKKIADDLLARGKQVYMPRIDNQSMKCVKVYENSKLIRNDFGILEPIGKYEEIDDFVAIVPCLAVDKKGNRLGYGKGFYDKFLHNKKSVKIAICYDFQIIDEIEAEDFDVQMDFVVSDARVLKLKN